MSLRVLYFYTTPYPCEAKASGLVLSDFLYTVNKNCAESGFQKLSASTFVKKNFMLKM